MGDLPWHLNQLSHDSVYCSTKGENYAFAGYGKSLSNTTVKHEFRGHDTRNISELPFRGVNTRLPDAIVVNS